MCGVLAGALSLASVHECDERGAPIANRRAHARAKLYKPRTGAESAPVLQRLDCYFQELGGFVFFEKRISAGCWRVKIGRFHAFPALVGSGGGMVGDSAD